MEIRNIILAMFIVGVSPLVNADVSVIPLPDSVKQFENCQFEFTTQTAIVADVNLESQAKQLNDYLSPAFGFSLVADEKNASANKVILKLNSEPTTLGDEGYRLKVDANSILIEASKPVGVFYGIQTLRQMLPAEAFGKAPAKNISKSIPCVEIEDSPRFGWRGLHLDVCRHFMPGEFVKKYLDLMALYKFNRFHWHLIDDQGWRIEIDKYPLLTKVGAWRDRTLISLENGKKYDNTRYGGFYTKEQIREVVKYAKDRNIEIVPEIEMPGHSSAAITAYPWLSCAEKQISVQCGNGIFKDVYCPGKEEVFEFNQDVLKEVMELFPYEYIHIGGDEVKKGEWKNCKKCQARIASENLKDVNELQSYFIKRIEKFLIANNRKMIGWDEILEGGLAPEATMMCWREEKYAAEAVKQGHDVIMAPHKYCYFDYYQSNPAREPYAGNPKHFLPIEKVYSFDPASGFSPEQGKHILGVQANVWTEWIRTPKHVEYMAWPRACAIAELGWTKNNKKDFKQFQTRLEKHKAILKQLDVNFFKERDITKSKDAIRLMTYNILYGGEAGRGEERYFRKSPMGYFVSNGERLGNIINIIKQVNPDIVFLQECNGWEKNDSKILKDVAKQLGMYGAVTPNRNRFKVALLSKFPMSNIHWLDDKDAFSHNIIYADVAVDSGQTITVASQHFGWWGDPKWSTYDANQQKESYINQYNELMKHLSENKDKQFVIAGDWNHSFEDSFFDQNCLYSSITGLGYVDGCFSVYKDYTRITSGSFKTQLKTGPIDFIFISPVLSKNIIDADIVYSVQTFEASDHLPVWVDIFYKRK